MMSRLFISGVVALALLSMGIGMAGQSGSTAPWDNATWKVNVEKSTYSLGRSSPWKSQVAKREPWEGGFKITSEAVDMQGKAIRAVQIGKYDGKDNPVVGAQPPGTQSYRLIDGGFETVTKTEGQVTNTSKWMLSRDRKTLTQTRIAKDAQGRTTNDTIIWEKQ